jgi:uncharacterized OB-fold protein
MNSVTTGGQSKSNPHLFFTEGEATNAPGLRGARCLACGKHTLGRVHVCSHCFSPRVDEEALGQQAELIEFSIAHVPAGGFAAPYAIAQIRTAENLVLFAPLVGETDGLAQGEPLAFTLVHHDGGGIGFGYARGVAGEAGR